MSWKGKYKKYTTRHPRTGKLFWRMRIDLWWLEKRGRL